MSSLNTQNSNLPHFFFLFLEKFLGKTLSHLLKNFKKIGCTESVGELLHIHNVKCFLCIGIMSNLVKSIHQTSGVVPHEWFFIINFPTLTDNVQFQFSQWIVSLFSFYYNKFPRHKIPSSKRSKSTHRISH